MHEYAQVEVYLSTPRTEAELDDLNLALGRPGFPVGISPAQKLSRLRRSIGRRDQHAHVPASASAFLTAHGVAPLAAHAAAAPVTPPLAAASVHAHTPVAPAPTPIVAPAATPVAAPAVAAAPVAAAAPAAGPNVPYAAPAGFHWTWRQRRFGSDGYVLEEDNPPAPAPRTGNDSGFLIPLSAGLAVLAVLFLAILLWVNRDFFDFGGDDNISIPASLKEAVDDCPDSIKDDCRDIADDYVNGKITATEARNKLTEKLTVVNRDGNNNSGSNAGSSSGSSSNNNNSGSNAGSNGSGNGTQIISSSAISRNPNLQAVDTGDCNVQIKTASRVYIQSDEDNECTHTLSGIPDGWQATADGVGFTVDGIKYVNATTGFDIKNNQITFTLISGAIELGSPDIARNRYCMIYNTGLKVGKVNAVHAQPLPSWKPCN